MAQELRQRPATPSPAGDDSNTPSTAAAANGHGPAPAPEQQQQQQQARNVEGSWRGGLKDVSAALLVPLAIWLLVAYAPWSGLLARLGGAASSPGAVLTKEQLARYNGDGGSPLYLAFLGEVYDVSSKKEHYGKGGGYHFFVGRDASRAFVTGEFEKDLTDDLGGLTPEQHLGLLEWLDFYRKTYPFKGRLVGAFYDGRGSPTRTVEEVQAQAEQGRAQREAAKKAEQQYTGCNVRWHETDGGMVWCDGELHPRKVFVQPLPGGGAPSTRCACFAEVGWSDLRQLYPDCDPAATLCRLAKTD